MTNAPVISILVIVLVLAVAGGIALATVLVGNRHTRGITKGLLAVLAILFGVIFVGWMNMSARSVPPTSYEITAERRAAAEYYLDLADRMQQGQGLAPTMAQEYRQRAADILEQPSGSAWSTTRHGGFSLFAGSPLLLVPFAVIVYLLFKHGGTPLGIAALAAPFLIFGFGYFSFEKHTGYHTSAVAASRSSTPANALMHEADAGAATWVDETSSTAVAKAHGHAQFVSGSGGEMNLAASASVGNDLGQANEPVAEEEITDASTAIEETSSDEGVSPIVADSFDAPLPEWVVQPPKSAPNVFRTVIESGYYGDRSECDRAAREKAAYAVMEYLHELAMEEGSASAYVPPLTELGVTPRYIREQFVASEYYGTRDFSHADGMQQLYQLIEIDGNHADELLARWRTYERQERVQVVSVLLSGALATLAGALGLIKLDTYTKGYYTKRLFIGVPAAIIGIILLACMA